MSGNSRPAKWEHEPQSLAGKAVVVTGGSTGIGRATAILLASQGARVLIFGRHEPELQQTLDAIKAAGGEGFGITADQSKVEDVQRVFQSADEKLGGVDILVNSAAVETEGVMEGDINEMQYTVQTNIFGYIACSHEAVQRMKTKKSGHIVNIGSMSADAREPGGDVYVATKAAIQGFSGSLRKTANKAGIRVTLIEPGLVVSSLVDLPDDEQQEMRQSHEILPPEDIAECVYYCLTQPQRCDVVEVRIRPLQQLI